MKKVASYSIVKVNEELNFVLIRDRNGALSITNDAENVIKHLLSVMRKDLKLTLDEVPPYDIYYIDSMGIIDKLETDQNWEFTNFKIFGFVNTEQLEYYLGR